MASTPTLCVEGKDDQFVVINLLKRHGIELDRFRSVGGRPIIDLGKDPGVDALIRSIPSQVATAEKPIGFILDADPAYGPIQRWQSVSSKLHEAEVATPDQMPSGGFIGHSEKYKVRVGVWLMPNNQKSGTLETFLAELIAADDPLFDHAKVSVSSARSKGAKFSENAIPKAELRTWLAWQEEPGLTYGTAINAHYFAADSKLALEFVNWVIELFEIGNPQK